MAIERRWTSAGYRAAMIVGLLAFWIGMVVAARSYPSEYDWRYMTVSSLLYQRRDPDGYAWGRAGLAVSGACGLYWVLGAVREHRLAAASLAAGIGFMVLCALLPSRFAGVPKSHEILAIAAFVAVCVGLTALTAATLSQRTPGRRRPYVLAVSAVPLLPVILAAVAQTYARRERLPWVSLTWRARGIPVYWSFAFWEWLACAVYSALLLWLVVGRRASG
jgi:hypothetical protein